MTLTPFVANTAADPYPYYADLRAGAPFFRDEASGVWVATSERAVREVFGSRALTRPKAMPVPPAVQGTAAGRVFGHLVRMTDGPMQQRVKSAMVLALSQLDCRSLEREAQTVAAGLLAQASVGPTELGFMIPVRTMARVLGFPEERLGEITDLVADFVLCISPLSGPGDFEAAIAAAEALEGRMRALVEDGTPGLALDFRDALLRGRDFEAGLAIANAIGLLSQTFDATGALVSVALATMARYPQNQPDFDRDPVGYLRETARFDAPIQNTRRFFAAPDKVVGFEVEAGDAVLLVLASANRDRDANPDPDRFDPTRRALNSFTFSLGTHRCPGEAIALNLAAGTLKALLAAGVRPSGIDPEALSYKPSANARIPIVA